MRVRPFLYGGIIFQEANLKPKLSHLLRSSR